MTTIEAPFLCVLARVKTRTEIPFMTRLNAPHAHCFALIVAATLATLANAENVQLPPAPPSSESAPATLATPAADAKPIPETAPATMPPTSDEAPKADGNKPPLLPMALPSSLVSPVPDAPTNPVNGDLWTRVRAGFRMPELTTPAVKAQERFYASKPEFMNRVVQRSRRYLYFIVNEVERRGMPMEIALLPIVESAFVPKAQSHASASGLWQFIPSTGKRYGLERTWWYDGRQDVMAATYAALDYLQDLHAQFGDWQLALAAYNWGEGGVGRALSKTRARGLDDSFDTIRKPKETEAYVPKLMAIRNIIAHPESFGIKLPSVPDQPYFEAVTTGRHIDLELAARLAGTTVEEILHLNPGLIRPVFAAKENRKLLLPAENAEAFAQNLQSYDKPLLSWQPYVTKRGESIAAIAGKFDIAQSELRDINKIAGDKAHGQTILVPIKQDVDVRDRQNLAALISGASAESKPAVMEVSRVSPAKPAPTHKVVRGETQAIIAERYNLTVPELRKLNGLRGNHKIPAGTVLKVSKLAKADVDVNPKAGKATSTKRNAKPRQYLVKRGDTLDEIAKRHDVSVADLKKWNKSATKGPLRVGNKLEIRDNG